MILSHDEESSCNFSSFHAKPIGGRPHFRRQKKQIQMQKMNSKQALVPACLDHDNLFHAVVMVMKDAPCTES
jgi:hypothetical protein